MCSLNCHIHHQVKATCVPVLGALRSTKPVAIVSQQSVGHWCKDRRPNCGTLYCGEATEHERASYAAVALAAGQSLPNHITRFLLFFGKATIVFCTYSMGSHDTLRTLPKSPRRLRILAKACSSRKSHIHCAAPRGVRVDQCLAGEITCGTSKNITFYKGLTVIANHS